MLVQRARGARRGTEAHPSVVLICLASVGKVTTVQMLIIDDPGVPPEGLVLSSRVLRSCTPALCEAPESRFLVLLILLLQELTTDPKQPTDPTFASFLY